MIEIIYRYDPRSKDGPGPPRTPAEARQRLCEGNRDFVSLVDLPEKGSTSTRVIPIDLENFGVADTPGTALRQEPFAVVLGCSDARVPTELVFNQACNSLFVVRVAGNVLGNECLGSIDYAVRHLGDNLKLLVVLGHSGCGAVTAAVETYLNPAGYLTVASTHSLRAIIDRLLVVVRAAAFALEKEKGSAVSQCPGYRLALIEMAVILNAALTAKTLWLEFPELNRHKVQVVYGVYHLLTREVNLPANLGKPGYPGLFKPPVNEKEFSRLSLRLAGCKEILGLLEQV